MTPLLALRVWLRRAAPVEKNAAAIAVLLAVGLVAWALIPTARGTTNVAAGLDAPGVTTTTPGAQPTAAAGTTPPVVTSGSTNSATPIASSGTPSSGSQTAGAQSVAATDTCGPKGATDQGVTASTVTVAVALVNIAGEVDQTALNIRPDMQQISDAVADSINKAGGLHCRKIVTKYYKANPLSQSELHATCLQIIQDKPFAVFDGGGFGLNRSCLAQAKLPVLSPTALYQNEVTTYFPYIFSYMPTMQQTVRNWVLGLRDQGYFDPAKGFKKLGLMEENCLDVDGVTYKTAEQLLQQLGITGDKLTTFQLSCGPDSAPTPGPDQVGQAVLKMKSDGATHLLPMIDVVTLANFTQVAQQQLYHPRYASSDFNSTIGINLQVNADQFDGTVGITATRYGEDLATMNSPALKRCNKVMTDHGLRPYLKNPDDNMVGLYCDFWWMFQTAANHAPALVRSQLVDGLDKTGPMELSVPAVDAVFNRPRQVTGGNVVRPVQWHKDCTCWRIITPNFHPEY